MINIKTLSQRAFKSRQSNEYHEIIEMQDNEFWPYERHRLQVRIDRDSYDFQSSAVIEKWDGSGWRNVASIPYSLMKTPDYTTLLKEVGNARFQEDRNELVNLACLTLYGRRIT